MKLENRLLLSFKKHLITDAHLAHFGQGHFTMNTKVNTGKYARHIPDRYTLEKKHKQIPQLFIFFPQSHTNLVP